MHSLLILIIVFTEAFTAPSVLLYVYYSSHLLDHVFSFTQLRRRDLLNGVNAILLSRGMVNLSNGKLIERLS